MKWLTKRAPAPREITIAAVVIDDNKLRQRTAERQEAVRKAMGRSWIGSADARPTRARLDQLHEQALIEHAERERIAQAHNQHRTVLYMKGRQS